MRMGRYVGRESVHGEWADHYNCSVAYDNQTITFQTWHSTGLGDTPFGLPVAMSAGDSKPTWQAPRLSTTIYSNHSLEPQDQSLFKIPRFCIPIPQTQVRAQLGLAKTENLLAAFSRENIRAKASLMMTRRPEQPENEVGRWTGCEKFPGFGSASDDVQLHYKRGQGGTFNISTADYLSSRTCDGAPDLTWGHTGRFTCNQTDYPRASFERSTVWIEPRTIGGLLFGKVLCPHVEFHKGVRTEIPVVDLPRLCGSATFDNCREYYDVLGGDAAVLRRSKAPSCKATAQIAADGPPLTCAENGACTSPCSHVGL